MIGHLKMAKLRPSTVITRTPLRISFFGGGSDLKSYYSLSSGLVVSTTINKYLYVFVKKHGGVFDEKIRLNYSDTEFVDNVDFINNNIIRNTLKFLDINEPIYISTVSDMPQQTGLGSSSAFLVGLLNALYHFKGKQNVSAEQLAEEACQIEIDIMGSPIGKQDQYAAAFGGANVFEFYGDERVQNIDLNEYEQQFNDIFDNSLLVWTEKTRLASTILQEQNKNSKINSYAIDEIVTLAREFHKSLRQSTALDFLNSSLKRSWELKQSLSSQINSIEINELYKECINLGVTSAKLLGAGGGGFFFCCIPSSNQKNLIEKIGKKTVRVNFEHRGSDVIFRD